MRTKRNSWTWLYFAICIPMVLASAASCFALVQSIRLVPTPAYRFHRGGERRLLRLYLEGGLLFSEARLSAQAGQFAEEIAIEADPKGRSQVDVLIPASALEQETEVACVLKAEGETFSASARVKPQRKWTIFLLPHAHVDIGYTMHQSRVEELHWKNIDDALELSQRTKDYPEGARYKWNVEVLWAVESWLHKAAPEQRQTFLEAVRKGSMGLDAGYLNINTSLCTTEELLRQFSFAQELFELTGVRLTSMMQVDIPGASWGIVEAARQAGVRYFVSAPNALDRTGWTRPIWENKPFFWESASGKERILFWQIFPYSIGYQYKGRFLPGYDFTNPKITHSQDLRKDFIEQALLDLPDLRKKSSPEHYFSLSQLEQSGYPYDMLLLTWALSDNSPIDPELPDVVRSWNAEYAFPKIVIATTAEAMEKFEQRYGEKLPAVRGDFTEYWTDGAGTGAKETARNRAAAERAAQAETLWAMLRPANLFPAEKFYQAWRDVLLFTEHTWGAHDSVTNPDSELVKAQWKLKESFGVEANSKTHALVAAALGSGAGAGQRNQIDIFNTCSWPRTDMVILSKEQSAGGDRVVDASGRPVASQRLTSGELVFLAKDVPPFGANRFQIKAGAASLPSAAVRVEENAIRSSDYELTVDQTSGAIRSLRSTRLGRELVDAKAPTALNDYFYLPGENLKDLKRNGPVKIRVQEAGPLVASLLVESDAPGLKQLVREIRVVSGLDRVEMINTLDKLAIRSKEGIHFGFGFDIPAGVLRYDVPFAVVRPNEDQLEGACKNWLAVQRWVDISNQDSGVTWATLDAPLIEIGGITANLLGPVAELSRWIRQLAPSQTLYSWALNNHWHTNFRADQDGPMTFRYALRAHGAYDPAAATRFGMAYSQPLLAVPASGRSPMASRLRMRNERIIVAGLKPSDDGQGLILRLFNASGGIETANLEWSAPAPAKMWLSDLSEKKVKPLIGNIELSAWDFVTLRVE